MNEVNKRIQFRQYIDRSNAGFIVLGVAKLLGDKNTTLEDLIGKFKYEDLTTKKKDENNNDLEEWRKLQKELFNNLGGN